MTNNRRKSLTKQELAFLDARYYPCEAIFLDTIAREAHAMLIKKRKLFASSREMSTVTAKKNKSRALVEEAANEESEDEEREQEEQEQEKHRVPLYNSRHSGRLIKPVIYLDLSQCPPHQPKEIRQTYKDKPSSTLATGASVQGVASKPVSDVAGVPVPPSKAQTPVVVAPPVPSVQRAVISPVLEAVTVTPLPATKPTSQVEVMTPLPVMKPTSQVEVMTPLSPDIVVDTETRHLNRRSSMLSSSNSDEFDGQHHKKDHKKRSKEDKAKKAFLFRSLIQHNERAAVIEHQLGELARKREMLMTQEGLEKAYLASNASSDLTSSLLLAGIDKMEEIHKDFELFRANLRAESLSNNEIARFAENADKKFELYQPDFINQIDKEFDEKMKSNIDKIWVEFEEIGEKTKDKPEMYQADIDKKLELHQANTDKKFKRYCTKLDKRLEGFETILSAICEHCQKHEDDIEQLKL